MKTESLILSKSNGNDCLYSVISVCFMAFLGVAGNIEWKCERIFFFILNLSRIKVCLR